MTSLLQEKIAVQMTFDDSYKLYLSNIIFLSSCVLKFTNQTSVT